MTFETLKEKLAALPESERREIVQYLLSLNRHAREQDELAREMTGKMNCKDKSRWVSLDEVKARYANDPEVKA